MREAEVAINTYRLELRTTPPTLPFSDSTYAVVQARVQAALNTFVPGGAELPSLSGNRGPSHTDYKCMVEVTPGASPCLHADLLEHEKVHQEACKTRWSKLGSGGRPLRTAIEEEISAYQAELRFLNSELNRLSQSCWVWTGTITYAWHHSSHEEKTEELITDAIVDPKGQATDIGDMNFDHLATFRVEETGTVAEVDFSQVVSTDKSGTGKVRCRVPGGGWRYEDKPFSYHTHEESRTAFEGKIKGTVTVEVSANGKYNLSFSTEDIVATIESKRTRSDGGGCNNEATTDKPLPVPPAAQGPVGNIQDSVSGVMTPGSDEIVGKDDRPGPFHVMISWKLKRKYRSQ